MVSSRHLYRCDTCRTEYSALDAAETCEAVHLVEGINLGFKQDVARILAGSKEPVDYCDDANCTLRKTPHGHPQEQRR